jgi:hypothetical protein
VNKILLAEPKRGRGRPKHALNKKTLGLPRWLEEELGFRDPAEVLGEIYSMDFKALKKMVRSKAGQAALAMRLKAAEAAMPYLHARVPQRVQVDERLAAIIIHRDTNQLQRNQALIDEARAQAARIIAAPDEKDEKSQPLGGQMHGD